MKLLREYIREILTEDKASRVALAAELRDNPEWKKKPWDSSTPLFKQGRILKQLFHKHADPSFLDSLITVHWASSPAAAANLATKGRAKDEISANAYLPGKVTGGSLGEYGVLIKGHISLLANDMDDIWTGRQEDYDRAGSRQRTQSSGLNKTIFRAKDPDTYEMGNPLLVLGAEDWKPNVSDGGEMHSNEALVDNWKVIGFVQAPWDTEDEVLMDDELYAAHTELGIPLLTVDDINRGEI